MFHCKKAGALFLFVSLMVLQKTYADDVDQLGLKFAQSTTDRGPAQEGPGNAQLRSVVKRKPVENSFSAYSLNVAGLNYTEPSKITTLGREIPVAIQTFGVSLSYSWYYLTRTYRFSIEPFVEYLSSNVTDKDSSVKFFQSYVPTYATGLDVGWPFYYSRKSLVASVGLRSRYRIVNFQKLAATDSFKDRSKLLYDINLKTYFGFSDNIALLQDLALSPQYGLGLRFGVSWNWR